jgi:hypothetical protein
MVAGWSIWIGCFLKTCFKWACCSFTVVTLTIYFQDSASLEVLGTVSQLYFVLTFSNTWAFLLPCGMNGESGFRRQEIWEVSCGTCFQRTNVENKDHLWQRWKQYVISMKHLFRVAVQGSVLSPVACNMVMVEIIIKVTERQESWLPTIVENSHKGIVCVFVIYLMTAIKLNCIVSNNRMTLKGSSHGLI